MLAFEFLRIFLYHYLFYPIYFDFFCPVEGKKKIFHFKYAMDFANSYQKPLVLEEQATPGY